MYLVRPAGEIKRSKGVNNKVADGATLNSTFMLRYVHPIIPDERTDIF